MWTHQSGPATNKIDLTWMALQTKLHQALQTVPSPPHRPHRAIKEWMRRVLLMLFLFYLCLYLHLYFDFLSLCYCCSFLGCLCLFLLELFQKPRRFTFFSIFFCCFFRSPSAVWTRPLVSVTLDDSAVHPSIYLVGLGLGSHSHQLYSYLRPGHQPCSTDKFQFGAKNAHSL